MGACGNLLFKLALLYVQLRFLTFFYGDPLSIRWWHPDPQTFAHEMITIME